MLERKQDVPLSATIHGVTKGLIVYELKENYTDPISGVSHAAGTLLSIPVCHVECPYR